jgi:hypothetical protein
LVQPVPRISHAPLGDPLANAFAGKNFNGIIIPAPPIIPAFKTCLRVISNFFFFFFICRLLSFHFIDGYPSMELKSV